MMIATGQRPRSPQGALRTSASSPTGTAHDGRSTQYPPLVRVPGEMFGSGHRLRTEDTCAVPVLPTADTFGATLGQGTGGCSSPASW